MCGGRKRSSPKNNHIWTNCWPLSFWNVQFYDIILFLYKLINIILQEFVINCHIYWIQMSKSEKSKSRNLDNFAREAKFTLKNSRKSKLDIYTLWGSSKGEWVTLHKAPLCCIKCISKYWLRCQGRVRQGLSIYGNFR